MTPDDPIVLTEPVRAFTMAQKMVGRNVRGCLNLACEVATFTGDAICPACKAEGTVPLNDLRDVGLPGTSTRPPMIGPEGG